MTEPTVVDKRPTYDDTPTEPVAPKPFTATPLGDYVVVRRIEEEEGLIKTPDSFKDKPLECEVLAISKWSNRNGDIKVGDKVLVRRFSGTEVKVDDQEVTLVLVHDILLVL